MNELNTLIKSQRLLDWILRSKTQHVALAGAAQLVGCRPVQRPAELNVTGLIPVRTQACVMHLVPSQQHV